MSPLVLFLALMAGADAPSEPTYDELKQAVVEMTQYIDRLEAIHEQCEADLDGALRGAQRLQELRSDLVDSYEASLRRLRIQARLARFGCTAGAGGAVPIDGGDGAWGASVSCGWQFWRLGQ